MYESTSDCIFSIIPSVSRSTVTVTFLVVSSDTVNVTPCTAPLISFVALVIVSPLSTIVASEALVASVKVGTVPGPVRPDVSTVIAFADPVSSPEITSR